jgi:hypothetical protein
MPEKIVLTEPVRLFEVDEHIPERIGQIIGGHRFRLDTILGPLNKKHFANSIRQVPDRSTRHGKKLFKVVRPLLDQLYDATGEEVRFFNADFTEARRGSNPRGDDWHSDTHRQALITDLLPTQVLVGEISEESPLFTEFVIDGRAPVRSSLFDTLANQAVDRRELEVITLDPTTAYLFDTEVHRPKVNDFPHTVERRFMNMIFEESDLYL